MLLLFVSVSLEDGRDLLYYAAARTQAICCLEGKRN